VWSDSCEKIITDDSAYPWYWTFIVRAFSQASEIERSDDQSRPDYNRDKWGRVAKSVLRLGERLGSRWANKVICISDPIAEDIQTDIRKP